MLSGASGDDKSSNSTPGKRKSTSSQINDICNKRTKAKFEVGCQLSRGFPQNAKVEGVRESKDGARIYKCRLADVGMAFELTEDCLQSLSECGVKNKKAQAEFDVGYTFVYTVYYDGIIKSWSDEKKEYTIAYSDNDIGVLGKGNLDDEMEDGGLKILGEGGINWFSRDKKLCKCVACLMSPDDDCLVE